MKTLRLSTRNSWASAHFLVEDAFADWLVDLHGRAVRGGLSPEEQWVVITDLTEPLPEWEGPGRDRRQLFGKPGSKASVCISDVDYLRVGPWPEPGWI